MSDHDVNSLKEKAQIAQLEQQAVSQDEEDFRKRERRLVRKLDLYIAPLLGLLTVSRSWSFVFPRPGLIP